MQLMKKPMIFYCYDLSKFEKSGRGFYGEYKSIVPGPIAFKTEDVVNSINGRYKRSKYYRYIFS